MDTDADRVLSDLRDLAALTSNERGAQRVAFTPAWTRAREWLRARLAQLPVEVVEDGARNLWVRLAGERDPPVAVGSHLDSVPDGGWLDGALGVVAGLELLRAAGPAPTRSLLLVDWADEEGRFGPSLVGSTAVFGTIDLEALRAGGAGAVLDLDAVATAHLRRPDMAAYLELHIEQGPVLEAAGVPVAAVRGTYGVRRGRLCFRGRAAHAGATPLDARHDPVAAAARFVLGAREAARRVGGLVTVGVLEALPPTPTAVAATCRLTFDARHAELDPLERLRAELLRAARDAADAERVALASETLWRIDPIAFDATLVGHVEQAAAALGARHPALLSGPLHDAAQPAQAGIPAAMVFVRSRDGISHSAEEDSDSEDIRAGVRVLAAAVARAMDG
jgi:hydantoinase/carbamoylase family amidase